MLFSTMIEALSFSLIPLLNSAPAAAGRRRVGRVLRDYSSTAADGFSIASDIHDMATGPRARSIMFQGNQAIESEDHCLDAPELCDDLFESRADSEKRDVEELHSNATTGGIDTPPGVPQYNYDTCINDMRRVSQSGKPVRVTGPVRGNSM